MSVTACTSVLGIDGQYVEEEAHGSAGGAGGKSGGVGVDATPGSSGGGGDQSGGAGGTAGPGAGGTASCGTNGQCPPGTKCCLTSNGANTQCVAPEPAVGCSAAPGAGCARCQDPPLNANPVCNGPNGDQCGFECLPNYVLSGDGTQCDPAGTGGRGGQGGTGAGGTPTATCDPKKCPGINGSGPGCSIASPLACCTKNNTCGCTYSSQLYCF